MINKLYEKIKKYIKSNFKTIISFLFVIICLITPLPYYIYIGGGTINISDRINLETEEKEKGSFNLAYVEELRATFPTYLLSYIMPDWKKESISSYTVDDNETSTDVITRDKLYLENANSSAIHIAYTLAGKKFEITNVYNNVIYVSNEAKTNIKVGDVITKIENKKIKDINEYKNYIESHEVDTKINLTVLRDGKKEHNAYIYIQNIDEQKLTGLSVLTTYDYSTSPQIDMKFKESESGSSGGFTTALAIYNKLTEKDITHGLKIVGTGTIDSEGNVGEIGGITYKLKGAVKSHADLFFVPKGTNYEEVIKFKEKKGYDIKIVPVENIKDAIDYLEKME